MYETPKSLSGSRDANTLAVQTQVSETFTSLACVTESLEKEIGLLHERLHSVIRDEPSACGVAADRIEKCYVPLAEMLRMRTQHLERLTEMVRSIRNRCEL